MACDYTSIKAENVRRFGTDIGRIGPMLLADRYDDRTHFIFELLQNAEDALKRRGNWQGSRAVAFALSDAVLRFSHFGEPFTEGDVRGVCGIAEAAKDLTDIGRFGIGFKSVYAYTDRPEVHSGVEDFAIENFVWPVVAPPLTRKPDETVVVLPLNERGDATREEITKGLERLGPDTLLFLRQIEEIAWSVQGGPSGRYLRDKPEALSNNVRRVRVISREEGRPDTEKLWLIFSREATTDDGTVAGHVEIAFSIGQGKESQRWSVQAVNDSHLVVFFPTIIETHLGFLVQGPYQTTPSRDNVPRGNPWNQRLVKQTSTLLVEALRRLRDYGLLDTTALRCLPINRANFGEGSMFAPLFEEARNALASEPLLPRFDGAHVSASNARIARTQELREFFGPRQLGVLLGHTGELAWLSGDITQDRTPELREYLMRELGIAETTPETILSKFDKAFLEAQPDEWILKLYEFLNGQSALQRRLDGLPLIRLEDGIHVPARLNGQLQAFLPGAMESGFPTVRRAVCATEEARKFLQVLGLTEPDPVDAIVRNILPKYRDGGVDADGEAYAADIRWILSAFGTDSKTQRDKLLAALRETPFVRAVDAGDGSKRVCMPSDVYLATERLKELLAGVAGMLLVDDSHPSLRGKEVRELLEACGVMPHLRPIKDNGSLSWRERKELRARAGHPETSSVNDHVEDWSLLGLKQVLDALPKLEAEQRRTKAMLLWEELAHLEERRGKGVFTGEYRWTHNGSYRQEFDAAFVRMLNTMEWVPDPDGNLQRPELVLFDSLGWKPNPFLLSKIRFKPPMIETLAKEAGFDPGLLDLLRKMDVRTAAELKDRLGMVETPPVQKPKEVPPKPPPPPGLPPPVETPLETKLPQAQCGAAGKDDIPIEEVEPVEINVSKEPHIRKPRTPGDGSGKFGERSGHPEEETGRRGELLMEKKILPGAFPGCEIRYVDEPEYDFIVKHPDGSITYVEVKSSASDESEFYFKLSWKQKNLAEEQGKRYQLWFLMDVWDGKPGYVGPLQFGELRKMGLLEIQTIQETIYRCSVTLDRVSNPSLAP